MVTKVECTKDLITTGLPEFVESLKLDQLISYNADEKVRERFDGWNMNAFSHVFDAVRR